VDVVAINLAEGGAKAADESGLAAEEDPVVAHDVVPHRAALPTVLARQLDGGEVAIVRTELGIARIGVFAQRNADARGVADGVVFDDPALGPVRANQADLLGGRRCPGGGGTAHFESTHGDEIHAGLRRIKHRLADVDFHTAGIRIDTRETRPKRGFLRPHLAEPLRLACRLQGLQRGRLRQPIAIQIHRAGVCRRPFASNHTPVICSR
jgi:hypothetical protein